VASQQPLSRRAYRPVLPSLLGIVALSAITRERQPTPTPGRAGVVEWRPAGEPTQVRSHDFPDPEAGKVVPYGVYDLTRNSGWVSVGIWFQRRH